MGIEITQSSRQATPSASLIDDKTGGNTLHLAANSRVKTTLIGQITQTSPGVMTGLGGDTSLSLPGGAVPTTIRVFSNVPASTGATITVGIDTTSTYFLNALSVATLAASGQQLPTGISSGLYTALAAVPIGSAHAVTGFYSQTATAPGGGPWFVEIDYYLPQPA